MPTHPLRRISTGSLSSLARSTDRTHAPSDLDFLTLALTELADEAASLGSNVSRLNHLHDALGTFNEGFSAYLYAMKMNAFSLGWDEAPCGETWARVGDLNPQPQPPQQAPQQQNPSPPASPSRHDTTYMTAYSDGEGAKPSRSKSANKTGNGASAGTKNNAAAAKRAQVAAQRKKSNDIAHIIDTQLPLEYRGDPDARLCMEKVIGRLWDGEGLAIGDMVKTPEMPHPRVNKCLIALVAKKLVAKSSVKGKTLYTWVC